MMRRRTVINDDDADDDYVGDNDPLSPIRRPSQGVVILNGLHHISRR